MNIEHYKAASEATDADERALIPPFTLTNHVYNRKTMAYEPRTETGNAHSPLPWEIIYTDNEIETTGCGPVKARYSHDNEKMKLEAEANAKLIVASVNHADDLARTLKWIRKYPDVLESTFYTRDIDALIAKYDKAKGDQ